MILLLACAAPLDPAELEGAGPHAVGYRESEVVYADPAGEGDRALRLAEWYPTGDTSGVEPRYIGLFEAPGVWQDATPAEGDFPLVLFSHGHQGFAENSGFLMAHLASHGWRVVAPDHTGNTLADGADRTTEIYFRRPFDLSAVLDAVDPTDTVVAVGHSFGGYTAFAAAGADYAPVDCAGVESAFCSTMDGWEGVFAAGFTDDRIDAIVPMAPGDFALFGADGVAATEVPALLLTGELDRSVGADAQPYWDALAGPPHVGIEVLGAGHQAFTDFAGVLEDGSTLDPEEGKRITRVYVLAFARLAAGDTSVQPVLDGTVTISEHARLR